MVAVPADEGPVRESPERSPLVLSALLDHERFFVNHPVKAFFTHRTDFEAAVRCIQQRFVHEYP